MRTATTPISTEILREALGFPDTVEIVGELDGNINLTVRSELIPEGESEVIATWIAKGKDGEPEFRSFDPMMSRPEIAATLATDEPPTPAELSRWRILTQDGNWSEAEGWHIQRDEDWIEIAGDGKRHMFHKPQSVEQIQ